MDGMEPRAQRLSASWSISHRCEALCHGGAGCAQRLSASWTISRRLIRRAGAHFVGACSTPVGVMDDFTSFPRRTWSANMAVLNACRRHGRFHTRLDNLLSNSQSAQRLSASWTISLRMCGPPRNGAQRLSASWTISPLASWTISTSLAAKNMCSTPVGVMDDFTYDTAAGLICRPRVLNACRRHGQRISCYVSGDLLDLCCLCSTPVGVMDDFTPKPGGDGGPTVEINACRRHGRFH